MNIFLIILGMAGVTYLSRLFPLLFLHRLTLPPRLRAFMRFVPFAALGALIFPGVFTGVAPEELPATIVSCLAALLLAYREVNLVLTVLGAILVSFLMRLYF